MDGGIIKIQSGLLNLGPINLIPSLPNASVEFTGQTGTVGFYNEHNATLSEVFDAATHDLHVTASDQDVAVASEDIHLRGAYNAADFSIQNDTIVYTAHHHALCG